MTQNLSEILTRGVEAIYPSKEELLKLLKSGKKLRIYNGIDPTTSHLHLGHMVVLRKLAAFQNLGHHIILLIGDFTGMIGDPTGKLSTRQQLNHKQVLSNAKNYPKIFAKFLKLKGSNPAEIKYNGEWLSKLSAAEWLKLAGQVTYQQLIERDMFRQRLKKGKDVFLHELFYPLLQAYDSVVMDVDMEVGGTDQTFNMLMGRHLMRKLKKKGKFVLATKLLTDPSGEKIGKTEGNVINLDDKPNNIFGQTMALPDIVMPSYFELLTDLPEESWPNLAPMEAKKLLGVEILTQLFSEKEANFAKSEFEKAFQQRKIPQDIRTIKPKANNYKIINILVESNLVSSNTEAKRLLNQGAIEVNQVKISNPEIIINSGSIIKVGKYKFLKII